MKIKVSDGAFEAFVLCSSDAFLAWVRYEGYAKLATLLVEMGILTGLRLRPTSMWWLWLQSPVHDELW
jgi:hypothetical protein